MLRLLCCIICCVQAAPSVSDADALLGMTGLHGSGGDGVKHHSEHFFPMHGVRARDFAPNFPVGTFMTLLPLNCGGIAEARHGRRH